MENYATILHKKHWHGMHATTEKGANCIIERLCRIPNCRNSSSDVRPGVHSSLCTSPSAYPHIRKQKSSESAFLPSPKQLFAAPGGYVQLPYLPPCVLNIFCFRHGKNITIHLSLHPSGVTFQQSEINRQPLSAEIS